METIQDVINRRDEIVKEVSQLKKETVIDEPKIIALLEQMDQLNYVIEAQDKNKLDIYF